ncbi:MAG: [Fe-Fe] hydrogenase large subunit C-terminal domain-containing protein, partial [Anaerotardibacter sp.]
MYNVTIDGVSVEMEKGATILDAAYKTGTFIPTLCWMKEHNEIGSCRICVVDVEGNDALTAACTTPVYDGMVINTNTPKVIAARRETMRTILEGHRSDCTTCERTGTCALQATAARLAVGELDFDPVFEYEPWDEDFPLQRDASKCIRCGRCIAECAKVQHCNVWDYTGPSSYRKITVRGNKGITEAGCALCGQCITHCPTGALTARNDIDKVLDALANPEVMTVIQFAPAIRSAWGEAMGLTAEEATPGRMAAAARRLGFDKVFDTDFAADLTIMEEGNEFIEYFTEGKKRPMFTSCCPGWVRFAKLHYPEIV